MEAEGLAILTADRAIAQCEVETIWRRRMPAPVPPSVPLLK